MNQIAAAILILSASICGYASAIRPQADGFSSMMTLVALGLGLWGGLALLTATTLERDTLMDDGYEPSRGSRGSRGLQRIRSMASQYVPVVPPIMNPAVASPRSTRLSPEIAEQVSAAAQHSGTTRQDVVDDILRRNLPRYSGSRVA